MSLRSFLQDREKNVVKQEVEPEFEVAALASQDQSKPILFESVGGYDDPIFVSNLVSSREMIADSLGVKKDEILFELSEAYKDLQECEIIENGFDEGYSHITAYSDKKLDIESLFPILSFYKDEEGKAPQYMASSIVIAKDPETGVQNMSFHRMMYHGNDKFTIRIVPRHLKEIYHKSDKELEIAVIRGVDPRVELAAATSGSPDMDELEYANALMDGDLKLTEVNGLKVPAEAELVILGKITSEKDKEGPFVDLSETWDRERQQPVFKANEVYMRLSPYLRFLVPGKDEHKHLMGLPQEPRIYKNVRETVPTVQNVVISKGGCSWLHGVVQIEKRNEGDGKNAGMAALAGHPSMKRAVIVDQDVDPSDSEQVEWAIATRVRPDKDISMIDRAKGSSLDPSQDYENRLMTKWIIDATVPHDKDEDFSRAGIPGEGELNLEKFKE